MLSQRSQGQSHEHGRSVDKHVEKIEKSLLQSHHFKTPSAKFDMIQLHIQIFVLLQHFNISPGRALMMFVKIDVNISN